MRVYAITTEWNNKTLCYRPARRLDEAMMDMDEHWKILGTSYTTGEFFGTLACRWRPRWLLTGARPSAWRMGSWSDVEASESWGIVCLHGWGMYVLHPDEESEESEERF